MTDMITGDDRTLLGSLEKLARLDVNIFLANHGNPLFQYGNGNTEKALERARISLENS